MNRFEYNIDTKVYFGYDQLKKLGKEVASYGKKVLLTYGGGSIKKSGLYDNIMEKLKEANLEVFELSGIEPNPRIDSVRKGIKLCKDNNIDVVLAVGGGSTIDASKFIAAGTKVDFDPWDFFVKNAPLKEALPLVTVLTLAATGSEMDAIGVISNVDTNDKIGRVAPAIRPKASFLDPTLTYTVSKYQTACGSADIFSHIVESYFRKESNLYMIDRFMEGLMKTVIKYAPIAIEEPDNYDARANLMWSSSWAINGFIATDGKTAWSCHAMEHQLSAYYDITHGLGLAILTPRWMKHCLSETTADRFYEYGTGVFDIDKSLPKMEVAERAIELTGKFLSETLKLDDSFKAIDIDDRYFEEMAEKACGGKILRGYKDLSKTDIISIYEKCL